MTAAERSRDAILTFLGLVLLLLALEVFTRLSLDPGGPRPPAPRDRGGGARPPSSSPPSSRFRLSIPRSIRGPRCTAARATFTDPNALGVGIGLLVPLLFAAARPARRRLGRRARRALALVALVAAPVALESSGSRTGFLLAGAAAIFAGAIGLARARLVSPRRSRGRRRRPPRRRRRARRVLPRGGGIAAGGLLQRLGAAPRPRRASPTLANHRTMFWRTALEMTWDEPLSGIGLAGFPYEFPGAYARRHGADPGDGRRDERAPRGGRRMRVARPRSSRSSRSFRSSPARGTRRSRRRPVDPAARGAGRRASRALRGLPDRLAPALHEIGLLTSLVAAFSSCRALRRASRGRRSRRRAERTSRGILAAAGILGAFVAVLPTARPSAPFRLGRWIGLYSSGRSASPFRWSGPRACREIRPGETSVSFRVENARPDGAPVTLAIDVDGRSEPPFELPGGVRPRSRRAGPSRRAGAPPERTPDVRPARPDGQRRFPQALRSPRAGRSAMSRARGRPAELPRLGGSSRLRLARHAAALPRLSHGRGPRGARPLRRGARGAEARVRARSFRPRRSAASPRSRSARASPWPRRRSSSSAISPERA